MDNYKLYGCFPFLDKSDYCAFYQLKLTKSLNYLEEANQFKNCPLIRQMTFRHIDNVKNEILFRIQRKTIVPYEKFIDVKKPNMIQFDHLLLTLIETIYYLNKQNIFIEKQSQLFVSLGRYNMIDHFRYSKIGKELKFRISEIIEKIQITRDQVLKNQIESQNRIEILQQLGTLNQKLMKIYRYMPKFLKMIDNDNIQAYEEQILLLSKMMKLSHIFLNTDNTDQLVFQQGKYFKENNYSSLNEILLQLDQFNKDYTLIAQNIKQLISENTDDLEYNKQTDQILTPLEHDLKVLTIIQYNYGLYFQKRKSLNKTQSLGKLCGKLGIICGTIRPISPQNKANDISDIFGLDWDKFAINLMNITKKQDKGFLNQIIMIKEMIEYFIEKSSGNLKNDQDFQSLKLLNEDLKNEKITMKFIIKHDYIKKLLDKKRLKELFAQLQEQGLFKYDFNLKRFLQKSFYNEMKTFYNIKESTPHDITLQFHSDNKFSDLRILEVRIHVLKELKNQIKQLFKHEKDKKDQSIALLNYMLFVYYKLIQPVINNISKQIDYEQFRAEFNKQESKNFISQVQAEIEKLQQNIPIIGTYENILNNLSEMDNQTLIYGSFKSLLQSPEVVTRFNSLVKYYKITFDQIYKQDPQRQNFYGYVLYRSLKFLLVKSMPYNLESLQLDLPYDYDYEEYYTTIRNGGTSDVIELINQNSSHIQVNSKKG